MIYGSTCLASRCEMRWWVSDGKYGNASFLGTSIWVYTVIGRALNRDNYGAGCPLTLFLSPRRKVQFGVLNEPHCASPGRRKTLRAVSGFSSRLFLSVRGFEIPQKSQSIISRCSQIPWHSRRIWPGSTYFLMRSSGNRTSLNLSTLLVSKKRYSKCSPGGTL